MIKIENFDNVQYSGISYGGHGGSKKGIILDGEKWFLKYPKSTKSMDVSGLSYTTTPLSEYIGSHIYEILGIDVHETKIGIANDKVVVACKDFLNSSEVIFDYNSIKNEYDENYEKELEEISSSISQNDNFEEVVFVTEKNMYFINNPKFKERFWDMFIVDAFISNNDRNEGNWGLVLDKATKKLRIPPVFDNGAAFYNKSNDEKIESILIDEVKFKQVVYDSSVSIYKLNDKPMNPLKYIESMENIDCNKALIRIFQNIDLVKIKKLFDEIPNTYNGLIIMTDLQKELYYKMLEYRYNKVFKPVYDNLINSR